YTFVVLGQCRLCTLHAWAVQRPKLGQMAEARNLLAVWGRGRRAGSTLPGHLDQRPTAPHTAHRHRAARSRGRLDERASGWSNGAWAAHVSPIFPPRIPWQLPRTI